MDYEVIWTEPAAAALEQIICDLATESAKAAESLLADIFKSVDVLTTFPMIAPVYERDPSGRTRELLCRRYRIFFRVAEESKRVEILTVWHSARREPRLPK